MKSTRAYFATALLSLLAACGGGGGGDDDSPPPTSKGTFTAIVSFGDSLSDVGSYAPATSLTGNGQPPYFGGKFTTNETSNGTPDGNALGKVWVELVASSLGIVVTPAEVGFDGMSAKCPAAAVAALATSCTGYGQGGAFVTDPDGFGHESGALTVPVVTQIANHLARFGSFKESDLVFVYAGNNDVIFAFAEYAFIAEELQGEVMAGTLTAAAAQAQLAQAQAEAEKAVRAAAGELADAVKAQILAKGARYVAVMKLSDINDSPFASQFPTTLRAELTALVQSFNAELAEALDKKPVGFIDTFAIFKEVYMNPAKYGFVNNTTPACSVDKIAVVTQGQVNDGSSLFCNGEPGAPYNGLVDGADVNTWQFADELHPTTGGHKAIGDAFLARLRELGWI